MLIMLNYVGGLRPFFSSFSSLFPAPLRGLFGGGFPAPRPRLPHACCVHRGRLIGASRPAMKFYYSCYLRLAVVALVILPCFAAVSSVLRRPCGGGCGQGGGRAGEVSKMVVFCTKSDVAPTFLRFLSD